MYTKNDDVTHQPQSNATFDMLHIVVLRDQSLTDKIFLAVTIIFLILMSFGSGAAIDLDILKAAVKEPIPLLIGFICQFVFMPLVSILYNRSEDYKTDYTAVAVLSQKLG